MRYLCNKDSLHVKHDLHVVGHSDFDFSRCLDDMKPTSNYMFTLADMVCLKKVRNKRLQLLQLCKQNLLYVMRSQFKPFG